MPEYRCSFCGKHQDQVKKLVAGGARPGTFICDDCIRLCNEILDEERVPPSTATPREPKGTVRGRRRWPWQFARGIAYTLTAIGGTPSVERWQPPR
jgi:hypothetical protein